MEKTVDQAGDTWYNLQVQGDSDLEGWVHYTLLDVPADVASQVPMVEEPVAEEPAAEEPAEEEPTEEQMEDEPVEEPTDEEPAEEPADLSGPTVSVFHGGNVRAVPGGEPVLDQIHADEQVELLSKNADSTWFFMRNPRGEEGWVHRTLLEPEELAAVEAEVPVAE
jgi:restriction system protein